MLQHELTVQLRTQSASAIPMLHAAWRVFTTVLAPAQHVSTHSDHYWCDCHSIRPPYRSSTFQVLDASNFLGWEKYPSVLLSSPCMLSQKNHKSAQDRLCSSCPKEWTLRAKTSSKLEVRRPGGPWNWSLRVENNLNAVHLSRHQLKLH